MSNLGAVMGDMKFTKEKLEIIVKIADADSEQVITEKIDDLKYALRNKGFNPDIKVQVLEQVQAKGEIKPKPIRIIKPNIDADTGPHPHLDIEV